jgi:hypothetical protein
MIPKIIHYCWFGGNPLPELAQKCIVSWKKFLPDYEIKEWNESNYDVRKIPYIAQAYDAKKYAFVSDYARFDILYQYGGIYFDTDVEVIKDLRHIIEKGAFIGVEKGGRPLLNAGLGIASPVASEIYKEILDSYKAESFVNSDGSLNLKTVVIRVSEIFKSHGFVEEDCIQNIAGTAIYPSEYFCPKDFISGELKITENTHTIHHYDGSWMPLIQKKTFEYGQYVYQKYGDNFLARNLVRIRIFFFRLHEDGIKKSVQFYLSKLRRKSNG